MGSAIERRIAGVSAASGAVEEEKAASKTNGFSGRYQLLLTGGMADSEK